MNNISWSWLPNFLPKRVTPPTCCASSFTSILKVQRSQFVSKSWTFMSDNGSPSIYVPWFVMRMVFNKPYWLILFGHQSGVNFPLVSAKSPGLTQVPNSTPFRENVISDGHTSFEKGNSEQISKLISNCCSFSFSDRKLAMLPPDYSNLYEFFYIVNIYSISILILFIKLTF